MNSKELKYVFKTSNGIVTTADLISAGISKSDIKRLCEKNAIEKVCHGSYKLVDGGQISEEEIISTLFPRGIVCMESALFYYGYNDFTPREWTIAIPRSTTITKRKLEQFPIRIYHIQNDKFGIGETEEDFNGVKLAVYDRERTICDCFKYRTRLDVETFNKAIKAYSQDEKKNLTKLAAYSKELKVYSKVMELMGVVLNG